MRVPDQISGTSINIPISLKFNPMDQAETVERDFVNKEISEAVNEVTDYEKARFTPTDSQGTQLKQIQYHVNLLDGGSFPTTTTYTTAGLEYDDVRFRKNRFKRSFIRLAFYDSDITTSQNLVSFLTLFCRLTTDDLIPMQVGGVPVQGGGLPNPINQIPIRFLVEDPVSNPEGIAEGYYLYNFKDEVSSTAPKELFMRASWNNAATGESFPLITDSTPQSIDNLIPKLHMKYILKRDNTGFFYEVDPTYSSPTNITTLPNDIISIQLYQIQVL
jgi:hypothetical protein